MLPIYANRPRLRNKASAFDPLDLSPVLWLKADAGTYQSSGGSAATADTDPVGQWQDQSGNARHFEQATAGRRPQLRTGVQNGLPVVRGDGSDDYLIGPDFLTGFTVGEIYLVVKAAADPPSSEFESGLYDFGSAAVSTHYPYTDNTVYDDFGTNTRKSTGNPSLSLGSFRVYNVVSTASEWTSYLDGVQHYTTGTNTVGWTTEPRLFRAVDTYYFKGDIGEVLLFSSALSAGDRTDLLGYLQDRWGL